MSRANVRVMKQMARHTQIDGGTSARQALVALLERSIHFRHHRLAVKRFCEATEAGASVSQEQLRYCAGVVPAEDRVLAERFKQASRAWAVSVGPMALQRNESLAVDDGPR